MATEPKIAQKSPYVLDEKTGTSRAWCACGLSTTQPFCDGTHQKENTGLMPIVLKITQDETIAWCGCKQSKNKPRCDGTHETL